MKWNRFEGVTSHLRTSVVADRRPNCHGHYLVFTCYQAALVLTRIDVAELDVSWHTAEQRDALPGQHPYARDGDMVDLASSQELLDCDPAIKIDMFSAGCSEFVGDLPRTGRDARPVPQCGSVRWRAGLPGTSSGSNGSGSR